jgi:hypothetical protein
VACVKDLILENEQNDVVDTDNTALQNMAPEEDLQQIRRRSRRKKICTIAAITGVKLIFAALTGNPISAVTSVVEAFTSR